MGSLRLGLHLIHFGVLRVWFVIGAKQLCGYIVLGPFPVALNPTSQFLDTVYRVIVSRKTHPTLRLSG